MTDNEHLYTWQLKDLVPQEHTGLEGLLEEVRQCGNRLGASGCRIVEVGPGHATFGFTLEGLAALFGSRLEGLEIREPSGGEDGAQEWIHYVPRGACVESLDPTKGRLWLALWRRGVSSTMLSKPAQQKLYKATAFGSPDEAEERALEAFKALTGSPEAAVELSSTRSFEAGKILEPGKKPRATAARAFLLDFQPGALSFYMVEHPGRAGQETTREGVAVLVMHIADLALCHALWPRVQAIRPTGPRGRMPAGGIVSHPIEAALDLLARFERAAPDGLSALHGVEVYLIDPRQKGGRSNPICKARFYVPADPSMIRQHERDLTPFPGPILRLHRATKLADGLPPHHGLANLLVRSPAVEDEPGFLDAARQALDALAGPGTDEEDPAPDAPDAPDAASRQRLLRKEMSVEQILRDQVRRWAIWRTETRTKITYRSTADDPFLAARFRADVKVVAHMGKENFRRARAGALRGLVWRQLFRAPFYTPDDKLDAIRKMLRDDWQNVQDIILPSLAILEKMGACWPPKKPGDVPSTPTT